MSTLFISDLHLEDARPEITRQLLDFLAGPARRADALYVLGDLFEFWIGDDAAGPSALQVASAFATLAERRVPVYFMHGNRDFLLGARYAALARFRLLPETVVVDLYGRPTLLLHGDTLCTDDTAYQAFRRQVRNPEFVADFLARDLPERLALARQARDASTQHVSAAPMEIMDVNEEEVRRAFARHGVARMIHGHTHRPRVHRYTCAEGQRAERIVLADWYSGGSYLRVGPRACRSFRLPG